MVLALNDGSDLKYNGYSFDGLMVASTVKGKVVYDDANRMVKWVEWTFNVKGYVTTGPDAGDTTDATLEQLRQTLTAQGKQLQYFNKGFGALSVNGNSPIRDVNWGPKAHFDQFVILGHNKAALVNWTCVVQIPECPGASYWQKPLMFNYDWSHQIDQDGFSVIRITGALEIAMTFAQQGGDPTRPPDTVDLYRERAVPAPAIGYSREQDFKVSKDRRRLDFTVTDTQRVAALPDDATGCDLDYTVESDISRGFAVWNCTLSGTVRMQAGVPRSQAGAVFMLVLASRMANIRRFFSPQLPGIFFDDRGNVPGVGRRAVDVHKRTLMRRFSVTEQVFGKDSRFLAHWWLFGSTLRDILSTSGLWRPIAGTSMAAWNGSLRGQFKAHSSRGQAGARHRSSDDILLDLCDNPPQQLAPQSPQQGQRNPNQSGNGGPVQNNPNQNGGSSGGGSMFTPTPGDPFTTDVGGVGGAREGGADADEWLNYRCWLELYEDDRVAVHKPVGVPVTEVPALLQGVARDAAQSRRLVLPVTPDAAAQVPDETQRVGGPSVTVRVRGWAVRFGFRINHPELRTVGGVPVVQLRKSFGEGAVGGVAGAPLWGAVWDVEYYVPRMPPGATLPVVNNPTLGTPGRA